MGKTKPPKKSAHHQRCHTAVERAVQRGQLPMIRAQRCVVCGDVADTYHHHTYREGHELDVKPLCYLHHRRVHLGRLADPATGSLWCKVCDEATACEHAHPEAAGEALLRVVPGAEAAPERLPEDVLAALRLLDRALDPTEERLFIEILLIRLRRHVRAS